MVNVGVVFRPQFAPERLREVAQACDRTGVDELWLWEDCFDHGGVATTAAALAWTERLAVGIGVLPVPLRNVAATAMELASIERMFPGRLRAGVGHGVLDWMAQVGARAASPMTLLREYTSALQALLAGDTVTVAGEYVRLDDVHLGWPPESTPPVYVGAVRPRTLALAGLLGDGVVLTSDTAPDEVAEARRIVERERAANRDPARVAVYVSVDLHDGGHRDPPRESAQVVGDPSAVAAAIRSLADAGADSVVLLPLPDADPVRFAHRVGEEVAPLVR